MKYNSYIPCPGLRPYINALVIQENAAEQVYRVLPGTELVIGFQYKGKLSSLHDGQLVPLSSSGVTGLQDGYRIFKNSGDTGTVLAYFKEAAAIHFFKQPLHELFRESVSLDNFIIRSELLVLEERLCDADSDRARIEVIEKFLTSRLDPVEPDRLVMEAIWHIQKNKGNVRIKELAKQLHISQSPFEKRFRQAVGSSPKKFASTIRFQNAIQCYTPGISLTELGYEAGFYDQSHFIKEFKTFTGETPEDYFVNK